MGKEPPFLLDILDVLQLKEFENLCMNITLWARLGSIKEAIRQGLHKFFKNLSHLKILDAEFSLDGDLVPRICSLQP
jgi:hypothetical protein